MLVEVPLEADLDYGGTDQGLAGRVADYTFDGCCLCGGYEGRKEQQTGQDSF